MTVQEQVKQLKKLKAQLMRGRPIEPTEELILFFGSLIERIDKHDLVIEICETLEQAK